MQKRSRYYFVTKYLIHLKKLLISVKLVIQIMLELQNNDTKTMFIPFGYILLIVSCTYISNLINSSSNLQETLSNKGYIDKGKYEGWYCTADEAFVPEDLTIVVKLPDGREQRVSTESNRPVEWFSEENYLFKLSKCREQLLQWMNSG